MDVAVVEGCRVEQYAKHRSILHSPLGPMGCT